MAYLSESGRESPQTLSCHIRQEIFNRRLAGSVEGNGITLAPEEGGYVLTVTNPSERKDADYEAFLTALFSVTENTTKEEPPQGDGVVCPARICRRDTGYGSADGGCRL